MRLAGAEGLAVIGMGKLGGRELNYASDVDVMFVDGDARDARAVMDLARRCFRVDANLRPEGRDGPLTRSVDGYRGVLGAVGPAVGVPGAAQGRAGGRRPRGRAGPGRRLPPPCCGAGG